MIQNAKWILCPHRYGPMGKAEASPEFRKEFELACAPKSATLQICGLGFFDAKINGQSVTERLLTPPFTAYDKRVYFEEYDVTALLNKPIGTNKTTFANTSELAAALLDEGHVAAVPGEAFGAPGYLRFSYALADDDLVEGMRRMKRWVED